MSKYTSTDGTVFEVTALYRDPTDGRDPGTWVHYRNVKTGQEYNCLYDAFMARFSKSVA
jgi:hypothetical protein